MGERTRVRGTERRAEVATVWAITAMAATGHTNHTGILQPTTASVSKERKGEIHK